MKYWKMSRKYTDMCFRSVSVSLHLSHSGEKVVWLSVLCVHVQLLLYDDLPTSSAVCSGGGALYLYRQIDYWIRWIELSMRCRVVRRSKCPSGTLPAKLLLYAWDGSVSNRYKVLSVLKYRFILIRIMFYIKIIPRP